MSKHEDDHRNGGQKNKKGGQIRKREDKKETACLTDIENEVVIGGSDK